MVLAELGQRISTALASISTAAVIDEATLDACLKEICTALLQSDVNVRLVAGLRNGVKKRVNLEELARGLNKQKIIEKARRSIIFPQPQTPSAVSPPLTAGSQQRGSVGAGI
jgi:signal recognition particle subunit SRP54